MKLWEKIREVIMGWPDIIEKPSQFGSPHGYYTNGVGFCHFHGENELDIKLSRKLQKKFLDNKRVLQNPYSDENILVRFDVENDADWAVSIVKLAYEEVKK